MGGEAVDRIFEQRGLGRDELLEPAANRNAVKEDRGDLDGGARREPALRAPAPDDEQRDVARDALEHKAPCDRPTDHLVALDRRAHRDLPRQPRLAEAAREPQRGRGDDDLRQVEEDRDRAREPQRERERHDPRENRERAERPPPASSPSLARGGGDELFLVGFAGGAAAAERCEIVGAMVVFGESGGVLALHWPTTRKISYFVPRDRGPGQNGRTVSTHSHRTTVTVVRDDAVDQITVVKSDPSMRSRNELRRGRRQRSPVTRHSRSGSYLRPKTGVSIIAAWYNLLLPAISATISRRRANFVHVTRTMAEISHAKITHSYTRVLAVAAEY